MASCSQSLRARKQDTTSGWHERLVTWDTPFPFIYTLTSQFEVGMTDTDPVNSNERTRGIFTEKDKEWLKLKDTEDGESEPQKSDQKRRCKKSVARAMRDLHDLAEGDFDHVSNLDTVAELFDSIDEEVEPDRIDCARSLIALAFIITNEQIDYTKIAEEMSLHDREPGQSPLDEDRPTAGGPVDFTQPVDDILAFRGALASGIKLGKEHYDEVPETVLIDSNTKLYKEATAERLKPPAFEEGLDTDDWADVLARMVDSIGLPGEDVNAIENYLPQDAAKHVENEIEANIIKRLDLRRRRSDSKIRRFDLHL